MKRILCWLGIHDWKYVLDNNTPYKYCKRCGKIKSKF